MPRAASCSVLHILLLAGCLASCGTWYRRSPHPYDLERRFIPSVASGECDGIPVIPVASLKHRSPEGLLERLLEEKTVIAIEGEPRSVVLCTLLAPVGECGNNPCGSELDCSYRIREGEEEICLSREDFTCGGTDCSSYCVPFSKRPKHRYRFVGVVEKSDWGQLKLSVRKFCRID